MENEVLSKVYSSLSKEVESKESVTAFYMAVRDNADIDIIISGKESDLVQMIVRAIHDDPSLKDLLKGALSVYNAAEKVFNGECSLEDAITNLILEK